MTGQSRVLHAAWLSRGLLLTMYGGLIVTGLALSLYLDALMVYDAVGANITTTSAGDLAHMILMDIRSLGRSLWIILMGLISSVTMGATIGSGAVIFSIASCFNLLFTLGVSYAMLEG